MKTEVTIKIPQLIASGKSWAPLEVAHVELSAEGVTPAEDAIVVLSVRDTTGQLVSLTHVSLLDLKAAVEAVAGVVL
ncbi:hypothetical protein LCGC14_1524520 [marine sediment metagenome]|uniref:Uncharacterized protein n=1 Tax=marine sediment metagenome TaxID=412755 RepID=A0A0F9IXT2_9ZZZZ